MASGLPIFVDKECSGDLVENNVSGFAIDRRGAGADDRYFDVVLKLVGNEGLCMRMGRAGVQKAARFRSDVLALAIVENYEEQIRKTTEEQSADRGCTRGARTFGRSSASPKSADLLSPTGGAYYETFEALVRAVLSDAKNTFVFVRTAIFIAFLEAARAAWAILIERGAGNAAREHIHKRSARTKQAPGQCENQPEPSFDDAPSSLSSTTTTPSPPLSKNLKYARQCATFNVSGKKRLYHFSSYNSGYSSSSFTHPRVAAGGASVAPRYCFSDRSAGIPPSMTLCTRKSRMMGTRTS